MNILFIARKYAAGHRCPPSVAGAPFYIVYSGCFGSIFARESWRWRRNRSARSARPIWLFESYTENMLTRGSWRRIWRQAGSSWDMEILRRRARGFSVRNVALNGAPLQGAEWTELFFPNHAPAPFSYPSSLDRSRLRAALWASSSQRSFSGVPACPRTH